MNLSSTGMTTSSLSGVLVKIPNFLSFSTSTQAKIGVNVNQIAKANNAGDMMELPINQLYKKIQEHISIVQSLLKTSTGIY